MTKLTRLASAFALALLLLAGGSALANDLANPSWSETDSSNNQASPNGWTSGTMLPTQVEPTARAMSGALKRWYDHANATIISAGAANAQTLTYPVAPAGYSTGDGYVFIAGLTNTGTTTLNVNGLGAINIQIGSASLVGGELVAGHPVTVYFDGAHFQLTSILTNAVQFGSQGSAFPYGGAYAGGQQSFATGTSPLGNNAIRATGTSGLQSAFNFTNLFPHGVLNAASTVSLTTNPYANDLTSDPGYGCVDGFAHVSDIADGIETGAVTQCVTANGVSPLLHVSGLFSSTQFTPAVPTTLPTGFPTTAVWIFSDDPPVPWEGLANATLNSSGQVTAWTVIGGWYQQGNVSGGTGVPGTPVGSTAYIGWQDKQWTHNSVLNLGWNGITGIVTNGNSTIPVSGSATQYLAPRQWLSDNNSGALAPHTRVVSVAFDYSSITVAPPPTGSNASDGITFSTQPDNRGVIMEGDINNGTGEAYDNFTYQFSGTTTSGQRHVSALSTTAPGGRSIYPRLTCKSANWGGTTDIDAIDYVSLTMDMDAEANASGATTITCQARVDAGGTGVDMRGVSSAADYVARGSPQVGFWGMGATSDYFLAAPAPIGGSTAAFGFRSDHSWGDVTTADFAITDGLEGLTQWSVNGVSGESINLNAGGALPSSLSPSQTLLHIGAADGNATTVTLDGFGMPSELLFRSTHGTNASPTALTSADQVGGLNFGGYDGSSWAINGAQIATIPPSTWSPSSHPLDIYFQTTPPNSTTLATNMTLTASGQIHFPARSLKPTPTGNGSCGVGASITGSDSSGTVTIGTLPGSSCIVTLATPMANAPNCFANDNTSNIPVNVSPRTTAAFVINGNGSGFNAGDQIGYLCIGS